MNNPQTNYTHRSWIAAAALVAVLIGVSFIPPQSIGSIKLRRANILADLFSFNDSNGEHASQLFNEEEFRVDLEAVAEIVADTVPDSVKTTFEWILGTQRHAPRTARPDSIRLAGKVVPIEIFDTTGRFNAFCDTLLNARRPVRIAVMGDSFIEGDILTADLREKLQTAYGGGGAGFSPVASPLTAFRRTVKTQSKGWLSYNIMQRKTASTRARDNFYISGWACQPSEGASTRWEVSKFRQRLDSCTTARLLFISPKQSRIEVTLNDSLHHSFEIEGNEAVRQIVVRAPQIASLNMRIASGVDGFIGYGAVFEADGISVDNYSIRSNNGQAMFWTNPSVNAQINSLMNYDLVILQYGLNIMQQGVRNYSSYGVQIEKMIAYVRQCFPDAAILVMGVSDRSARTADGMKSMDALPFMTACQRRAAANAGAAFWDTVEAMRNHGGMEQFVASGWAGKDFTHINYAGGRRIAWSLFDALNARIKTSPAAYRQRLRERFPLAGRPIVDTAQHKVLQRELQVGTVPTLTNDSNSDDSVKF